MTVPLAPPAVPRSLEEALTPAWFTLALQGRFPGVRVTEVVPGRLDERISTNASCTLVCEGGAPEGLPAELWVKGYFGESGAPARAVGAAETAFYRELAGPSRVRTLRCLHAAVDRGSGESVLVTADLAADGGAFRDPRLPLTVDEVASGLEQLAALHTTPVPAAAWLRPVAAGLVAASSAAVGPNLARPSADGLPAAVRDPERVVAAALRVAAEAGAGSLVLSHGDPHPGNVFVRPDGALGLLDWQLVQRACWWLDVGYHLASTLPVAERRSSERDLLAHYLDARGAAGWDRPGLDDALQAARGGMVYGLYLWCITARVDPRVTTVMLGRLGTAVADHAALDPGASR